ncbi:MAG: WG repeat-containing protein [Flavobacteriales bacterium]|nr:WG repeat-containing protein [Flavobacteriales bacterium]MCB9363293.1 WG repeat-containing protein [Flavobacteriales bacterium]
MIKLYLIILTLFISELSFSQTLIPYRKGNKWGYSNNDKQIIIKPKYKEVGIFNDKITWVKKGNKYGYINRTGKLVTKIEFTKASYFQFNRAKVSKKNEFFCIDNTGKKANCINGCNGALSSFLEFQFYKKDEKIGLLKYTFSDGVKIDSLPAFWDAVQVNNYYAAVKQNSKWGVINFEGELVTELIYDTIASKEFGRGNFFKVKYQNKYGFLNEKGEEIISPKYSKADFFGYGIAKVWINEKIWFYIDIKGQEFYEP